MAPVCLCSDLRAGSPAMPASSAANGHPADAAPVATSRIAWPRLSRPHRPQPVRPARLRRVFLETSEVLAGDLDLQGDAGVGFAANNVEDILPARDDAFRQAEADGEILEVGGGRQHHRVADAVVLEGDRRLLGQVVGARPSLCDARRATPCLR